MSARALPVAANSPRPTPGSRRAFGQEAAAHAAVVADHHVVEHRHGAEQRQVLERPADTERRRCGAAEREAETFRRIRCRRCRIGKGATGS